MGKFFYQVFITVYPLLIKIASPFNEKAKLWIKGRHNVLQKMRQSINVNDKIIWMHCASLGEFEQGRPLLEKLKKQDSSYKFLLTFFSPSGYEVRKNYEGADYIFYLPFDNEENAKRFYDIIKPKLIIFVKYEFWFYYLSEAKKRNIPLLLISAVFRQKQAFFSTQGYFYRTMLSCFTHLFVQNQESVFLLKSIGFDQNVSLSGDTRFDRVVEIAEGFKPISLIEDYCAGSTLIVAGSTWYEDDKELAFYANTKMNVKFIIAPHNISKDRLQECLKLYKHSALFSSFVHSKAGVNINVIIIDNIGMLSSLYKYATISYIGGGFGTDGVHNVLEAAVFGKPVVFGPKYAKFIEAVELVESGGAFSIKNAQQLEQTFNSLISKKAEYSQSANASYNYVYSKRGTTDKILQFIYKNLLLTN